MKDCWLENSEDRPTFSNLVHDLTAISRYQRQFKDEELLSLVRVSNEGSGYANRPIPENQTSSTSMVALPASVYFNPVDPSTKTNLPASSSLPTNPLKEEVIQMVEEKPETAEALGNKEGKVIGDDTDNTGPTVDAGPSDGNQKQKSN